MNDLLGRRLGGKYEIEAEIGRGGMGVVYRGHDLMLLRPVAIKVLPTEFTYNQQFVQRFRQEAILAASLHQPNIVTIFDVGEQDGVHYLVMQFLEGVTLDQWLQTHGPMALPQASHMVRQMADALDYAHSHGIVHRDVKPSNIMVGPNGQVTLMDFGLVRAGEGSGLTRTGTIVGTPEYMAPEQALGQSVDGRTDIYSFGVVIYRMLSGQVPFARSTSIAVAYAHVNEPPPLLRELRPDVPKPVEAVVFKALAKRPEERYQQASQLAAQFALAIGGKMPAGLKTVATPPPSAAGTAVAAGAVAHRVSPSSPRPALRPASNPALGAEAPTQLANPTTPAPQPAIAAPVPPARRPSRALFAGLAILLVVLAVGAIWALGGNTGTPEATGMPPTVPTMAATGEPDPTLPLVGETTVLPADGVNVTAIGGEAVLTVTRAASTVTATSTGTASALGVTPTEIGTSTRTRAATPTRTRTATPTTTQTTTPSPNSAATRLPAMQTSTSASPTNTPSSTNTAAPPTSTPLPPATNTPPPPTNTPAPPTNTPAPPTNTPAPPTNTPAPPTSTPPPTNTPAPPTDTPTSPPTATPTPPPTDTPTSPPTATPTPPPTDTPTPPPTDTPTPPPTATPPISGSFVPAGDAHGLHTAGAGGAVGLWLFLIVIGLSAWKQRRWR